MTHIETTEENFKSLFIGKTAGELNALYKNQKYCLQLSNSTAEMINRCDPLTWLKHHFSGAPETICFTIMEVREWDGRLEDYFIVTDLFVPHKTLFIQMFIHVSARFEGVDFAANEVMTNMIEK